MRKTGPELPIAAALVLGSGALLVWAGYVLATGSWSTALWISILPGVTIEAAFALIRRADRAAGRDPAALSGRVAQEGVALVAGAVMVLAGYAWADWTWLLTLPLVLVGGGLIAAAVDLGRGPGVHAGRYTAQIEGDFVVFLIGMRFNKPWKVHKWLPVATAMTDMLRMIDAHPELGCLAYKQWAAAQTTVMVQYWRDYESLDRFARDAGLPHLEPWRRFNRIVRDSGDVGIWHETYKVRADSYEALYGNMPTFGLAAAADLVPVAAKAQSAAARIGARSTDDPAVAPY